MADNVYFTKDELNDFIANHKKIGEGTEGICFKCGNEIYKIHKKTIEPAQYRPIDNPVFDDSGVRIYKRSDFVRIDSSKNPNKVINYKTKDGTVIHNEQALQIAIERGNRIIKSKTPQRIIYVNGVVRGCVYPYYKHASSIYKAYLKTYKTRLKICKSLIDKVKELVDNNIYPVDLCQKMPSRLFDKNYANVLLSFKNEPIIIDLDGRSTYYTEIPNSAYLTSTCWTLAYLVYEIITREDIQEDYKDENYDMIREYLSEYGLTSDIIKRFLDRELTMDDIDESIRLFESKRK